VTKDHKGIRVLRVSQGRPETKDRLAIPVQPVRLGLRERLEQMAHRVRLAIRGR
jgi:hypothetical protein